MCANGEMDMKKLTAKSIIPTTALALVALQPGAHAAEVQITAQGPVVELGVYESIDVEPDIATISAGVTTQALTAVEAMRQNSAEMRKVIERIKALNVDEKDIQTTGINLNARYDYDRNSQRQIFRGYQVSNRVSVKLRDINATGRVLDALVEAGATDLGGPNFSVDDDTAAKEQARQRAMTRARERAAAYARMAGYGDVRLLQISESITGRGPVPMPAMRDAAENAIMASAAPVQPGMVSAGVSITVKYEMVGG